MDKNRMSHLSTKRKKVSPGRIQNLSQKVLTSKGGANPKYLIDHLNKTIN